MKINCFSSIQFSLTLSWQKPLHFIRQRQWRLKIEIWSPKIFQIQAWKLFFSSKTKNRYQDCDIAGTIETIFVFLTFIFSNDIITTGTINKISDLFAFFFYYLLFHFISKYCQIKTQFGLSVLRAFLLQQITLSFLTFD